MTTKSVSIKFNNGEPTHTIEIISELTNEEVVRDILNNGLVYTNKNGLGTNPPSIGYSKYAIQEVMVTEA